jgi:hypothetical protein
MHMVDEKKGKRSDGSKSAAVDADGFPETAEVATLRSAGREVLTALRQLNERLRPLAVKLNDEERRSGVGKLLKGEAAELLKVARYAMDNPALVKGFAGKDGGVDPKVFEGDALAAHLAVHEAARSLRDEVEVETKEMLSLLGDLAIHRGVLARPVLLGVYKLFAQVAQDDTAVHGALKSVFEFFDRPAGKVAETRDGAQKPG